MLHSSISDLYFNSEVNLSDNKTPKNVLFNKKIADKVREVLYQNRGFSIDLFDTKAVNDHIGETFRNIDKALEPALESGKMPQEMRQKIENNLFIFSGFKTYHQLKEASQMLIGDNGSIASYSDFEKRVLAVEEKYNKTYLSAEYQQAVMAAESAAQWAQYSQGDSDRFDLQYRTASDEKVRESHRLLHQITLPPSDAFWQEYYPPNGWGCRCTVKRVRKGKYPASPTDDALEKGVKATTEISKNGENKGAIFRFNPGVKNTLFPPRHPYYTRGCETCKGQGGKDEQCSVCEKITPKNGQEKANN